MPRPLLRESCQKLRASARRPSSRDNALRLVVIQEAGRDGFWIHRLLEAAGIQSQVVDPGRVEKLGVPASRIPSFSGSAFTCVMSQYCSTGAAM